MYLLSKAQDITQNVTRLRKKLQIEYLELDTGSMVTRLCCIGRFTGNRDGILLVFEHQKSPGVGQSERKVKQPSELQKLRLRSIFSRGSPHRSLHSKTVSRVEGILPGLDKIRFG